MIFKVQVLVLVLLTALVRAVDGNVCCRMARKEFIHFSPCATVGDITATNSSCKAEIQVVPAVDTNVTAEEWTCTKACGLAGLVCIGASLRPPSTPYSPAFVFSKKSSISVHISVTHNVPSSIASCFIPTPNDDVDKNADHSTLMSHPAL